MRVLVLAVVVLASACGGHEEMPRLTWSQSAVTVSAAGSATLQLRVVEGKYNPLPARDWMVCLRPRGGGTAATPPAGYVGDPRPRVPFCVTFAEGQLSVDVVVAGAGAEALAGAWNFRAEPLSPAVDPAEPLVITQTVP